MTLTWIGFPSFVTFICDRDTNNKTTSSWQHSEDLEVIWSVNAGILLVFGILVATENLFLVLVYTLHRELHVLSNAFLMSLSTADLLYALTGVAGVIFLHSTQGVKKFSLGCLVLILGPSLTYVASTWSLVAITADRYFSIQYPFSYPSRLTRHRVALVMTTVWAVASLVTVTQLIPVRIAEQDFSVCGGVVINGIFAHTFNFSLGITLPTTLVIIMYYKITKIAQRHERDILSQERPFRNMTSTRVVSSYREVLKYRHIAKSSRAFCVITSLFISSWVPVTSSLLITLFCTSCNNILKATITTTALTLMLLTKLLNPWIYIMKNRHFKSAVKNTCKVKCHRTQVFPESDIYFSSME